MSPGIACATSTCSLPFQLEQVRDLERLLAVVDEQGAVLADGALVDAEHPELADEGIVDDLETSAITCAPGSGLAAIGSRPSPVPFTNGGGWLRPGAEQPFGDVSNSRTPARCARRRKHRHQVALAQALLEGIVQFLPGQAVLAEVEVMVHHRLVDLDHLVDDLLVPVGDRAEVAVASRWPKQSTTRARHRRAG